MPRSAWRALLVLARLRLALASCLRSGSGLAQGAAISFWERNIQPIIL